MRRFAFLLVLAAACGGAGSTDGTPVSTSSVVPARASSTVESTREPTVESTGVTTDGATVATDGTTATVAPPDAVTPVGFERVHATVTAPDGSVCELCLWLADTPDRRSQGLMRVDDLGDADGMAFVYPAPHSGNFWMKNTVLPLSIAFFGADGAFLDAFDMEPCDSDPCPVYPTPDDFLVAIEVVQGASAGFGMLPGSVLELDGLPCG